MVLTSKRAQWSSHLNLEDVHILYSSRPHYRGYCPLQTVPKCHLQSCASCGSNVTNLSRWECAPVDTAPNPNDPSATNPMLNSGFLYAPATAVRLPPPTIATTSLGYHGDIFCSRCKCGWSHKSVSGEEAETPTPRDVVEWPFGPRAVCALGVFRCGTSLCQNFSGQSRTISGCN